MGIQGLLKVLKPALKELQIGRFQGQTAVIDIMVWLYKGAYSCAYELATEKPTLAFLVYPIKMIRMLQTKGIKPICVFDGYHLKAKEDTAQERADYKAKNRELGKIADENGNKEEAEKYFSRSLVLRSRMKDLFMDILFELGIEFLVAPYEADAQMTYMVKEGIADFAISDDSDLIAYGCPRIAMKLNPFGLCQVFSQQDFKAQKNEQITDQTLKILQALPAEEFLYACIMAGCEYLTNI